MAKGQVYPSVDESPLGHNSDPSHVTPMKNEQGVTVRIPEITETVLVLNTQRQHGDDGDQVPMFVVPVGYRFSVKSIAVIPMNEITLDDTDFISITGKVEEILPAAAYKEISLLEVEYDAEGDNVFPALVPINVPVTQLKNSVLPEQSVLGTHVDTTGDNVEHDIAVQVVGVLEKV